MKEERRRELALGRLEHTAHQRYPRYHVSLPGRMSAVSCCPGPHVGATGKEVPGGMLRVYYRYSTWDYELNGRDVPRVTALEAFAGQEKNA